MKVLVVVDMQNDFIDGALGTSEAKAIVDNVVKRIEDSRGELILFTKDTHQKGYLETREGKKLPVVHCLEGTEGWEINEKVKKAWVENEDTIVSTKLCENTFCKPVFGSVELAEFLKFYCCVLKEIELVGVCTDICVISNAIMLKNTLPEVDIRVNASCCAGVTPQSHQEALNVMKMCQIDVV